MKKFLLAAFAILALAACQKEDKSPEVSFKSTVYTLSGSSVEVSIETSNVDATTVATKVPVTFGGTAKLGEDFTASAQSFTIGGANEVLTITLSTDGNYDAEKNITMQLGAADGVKIGKNPTATVAFPKSPVKLYSFEKRASSLTSNGTVTFELFTSTGENFNCEKETTINMEVDTEKSTAVEGTNFSFDGNKSVVIPIGKNSGSFKLKCGDIDPEHSTIVLKPNFGKSANAYVAGQYPEITINILGEFGDLLQGTWVASQFVTDKAYMEDMWNGMGYDFSKYPTISNTETITFEGDSLKTAFTGGYQNYFTEDTTIKLYDSNFLIHAGMTEKYELQLFEVSKINRYFSADKKSDDDAAIIGLCFDENNDLLLFIIDYEPADYFTDWAEYGMFNDTKPVITMTGGFQEILFKKK